jgi:hypothetical protein
MNGCWWAQCHWSTGLWQLISPNNSYVFQYSTDLNSTIHMDWLWFSTVEIHRFSRRDFFWPMWCVPARHYLCLEVLAKSPEVHVKSGDPEGPERPQGCDNTCFFLGGSLKDHGLKKFNSKMIWFWSTPPFYKKWSDKNSDLAHKSMVYITRNRTKQPIQ